MQQIQSLKLENRENTGSRNAKRLRKSGYIPAILYGKGINDVPVQIKLSDLRIALRTYGQNAIFNVNVIGEENIPIVVKNIQKDVITEEIIHVDFQKVSLTEVRRAEVPVRIHGRERIEASQLIVLQQMNEIPVICLPQNTPQFIIIDVSNLKHGDIITAGQIELPEGVMLDGEPEMVVISITEAREIVEEPKAEAASESITTSPKAETSAEE